MYHDWSNEEILDIVERNFRNSVENDTDEECTHSEAILTLNRLNFRIDNLFHAYQHYIERLNEHVAWWNMECDSDDELDIERELVCLLYVITVLHFSFEECDNIEKMIVS